MGKKSSKTKTTNEPPKWATPYLQGAMGTITNTVNNNQGTLDQQAADIRGYLPGLGAQAFGQNAGLNAATGYAQDVLGGKYLGSGNEYMNQMVDLTKGNVADDINTMFSKAGRVGGDSHYADLARGMSEAELGLRYGDYQNERNQMTQAAGLMPSLNASQYAGVMPYLAAQQTAAGLPYTGIGSLGALGSLAGGYGTQTAPGPGWGQGLLGAAASLGSAAIMASDRRLKKNIELVGTEPDGLNIYEWEYKNDPTATRYRGPMADEVKELRPQAYVPNYQGSGFDAVNYAKLSEAA